MSIVVVVHLKGVTPEKINEVNLAHPEVRARLVEIQSKYASVGHRRLLRLVRENEILDIDEWDSEEAFHSFKAEANETIAELARLRGAPVPEDNIWQR